jgi:hypothetical protein
MEGSGRGLRYYTIICLERLRDATPCQCRVRLPNIPEKIYRPGFKPLYATTTYHRKQETFLYEYPLHCSSVIQPWSMVAIFTTETNLWTCACASDTETVMKLDCTATWWCTQKTYYIYYSWFTSIYDLFTDPLVLHYTSSMVLGILKI